MSDKAGGVIVYPFRISDDQLEELVWRVNGAFLDRRKLVSLDRNVNPFAGLPVKVENVQLYVPGLSTENGSIYVENIEREKGVVCLLIEECLTTLVSMMKNRNVIEREYQREDDMRARKGNSRLRTFEGCLTTVAWFDELVVRELAEAFVAITGQRPTIGGYKRPSGSSERAGKSARKIESPFAVFALYLIEISELKRLGAGAFTINVLRKAMAPYYISKRKFDGAELEDLADAPDSELNILAPKRRGRPPKAHNRDVLRDPTPVPVIDCSSEELAAMDWVEVEVD
jgi:hypothetical protein